MTDPFRHASAAKVPDVVIHELVRDITTGDLQRWPDIPHEADLIERYGVGRASLREALRVLDVLGLISLRRGPRGGPTALGPGCQGFARMTSLFLQLRRVSLAQVVDCWMAFQPLVARMAAQRGGSAEIAALAVQVADEQVEEDAAFLASVRQVHGAVLQAAGNPVIGLLVDALEQMIVDRCGRFLLLPVDQRPDWVRGSGDLLTALLAGRPEQAESCGGHLSRRFREHLDEHPAILDRPIDWG